MTNHAAMWQLWLNLIDDDNNNYYLISSIEELVGWMIAQTCDITLCVNYGDRQRADGRIPGCVADGRGGGQVHGRRLLQSPRMSVVTCVTCMHR